jgi:hypothetical protein
MDKFLCKLTFVCPPDSADRIVELMLSLDPPIPGFTTWDVEGHGFGFAGATVSERVRGRIKKNLITAVIERADAERLLQIVAQKAPVPHLTFWIEPIERFGRLQALKPTCASPADREVCQ